MKLDRAKVRELFENHAHQENFVAHTVLVGRTNVCNATMAREQSPIIPDAKHVLKARTKPAVFVFSAHEER